VTAGGLQCTYAIFLSSASLPAVTLASNNLDQFRQPEHRALLLSGYAWRPARRRDSGLRLWLVPEKAPNLSSPNSNILRRDLQNACERLPRIGPVPHRGRRPSLYL
jgi:hypothetical protein